MSPFYENLNDELDRAYTFLEDAEDEGWTREAIDFQKRYIDKLEELKEMAKQIYE